MTLRSAPRAASRKYFENARYAVTLGAAFALLCAVVFDPQESSAAGGFLELLFGAFNAQQAAPDYGYSNGGGYYGFDRRPTRRRHARRATRGHYAYVRKHSLDRREQMADRRVVERRAVERRAERRQQRIAQARAAERRRLAAERRANENRYAEAQTGWREAAAQVEKAASTPIPGPSAAPAEPVVKEPVVKKEVVAPVVERTSTAKVAAAVEPKTAAPVEPKTTAKRAANGQYVPRAIVNPTAQPVTAAKSTEPPSKATETPSAAMEQQASTAANVPLPPQIDRSVSESPKTEAPVQIAASAEATATNGTNSVVSRRPVCVRACDGYYFPIASKTTETSAQQSCEKLCPGAQTRVFMIPGGSTKIEEAVAAQGGETYAQFVAKLNPQDAKAKNCACPTTVGNLHETGAFLSDLTLRPGDTVVTPEGVRVVRRGSHYPFKNTDFLSLAESHNVSPAARGALVAIEKALKTPYGRLAVASNSDRRRHRHAADL